MTDSVAKLLKQMRSSDVAGAGTQMIFTNNVHHIK